MYIYGMSGNIDYRFFSIKFYEKPHEDNYNCQLQCYVFCCKNPHYPQHKSVSDIISHSILSTVFMLYQQSTTKLMKKLFIALYVGKAMSILIKPNMEIKFITENNAFFSPTKFVIWICNLNCVAVHICIAFHNQCIPVLQRN